MNREYHRWYSPSLNRDMELLIFGHAGARVIFEVANMGDFVPQIIVQISTSQRRNATFIICAEINRQAAACCHFAFKCFNQQPPNPFALMRGMDSHRVEFPNVTLVH